jgi:hypothetical protein
MRERGCEFESHHSQKHVNLIQNNSEKWYGDGYGIG